MSLELTRDTADRIPAASFFRAMPWLDATGRFSALRTAVLAALAVPVVLIAFRYADGALGARPLNEAVHQIGNWAIRLIFVSLAITPASRMLHWPALTPLRRMVGVAAFLYVAAHFALYVTGEAFDLGKVATEIASRIYLTIGFVGLLILSAMAATSTDGMARRLGGRRWRRLHRTIYFGALLAVVHFFMQTKANIDEPLVMAGLYVWLMGYRALAVAGRMRGRLRAWLPALLGFVAGIATALGEALYYWIKLGVTPLQVLSANLTFALGPRPGWIVAAICLMFALAGAARLLQDRIVRPA